MARLYLIRHGEAAAGFAGHRDPGLSDLGREQAHAVARALASVTQAELYSSPLARAQETAAPLAELQNRAPQIEPALAEIPSPTDDLAERARWLREAMSGRWQALPPAQRAFREALVARLIAQATDAIFFSHFVAINLAVGAATGDDRMHLFAPDNGSITELETDGQRLTLIAQGREASTYIN
ncbi:MAG: histidine phosphatase family protein [Pseudomonadota bacterium]